jgi:hypothetical protein
MAGMAAVATTYLIFLVPLLALAGMALRGRLAPAIALVVLPTFLGVAATIAFAIGVAIYGF